MNNIIIGLLHEVLNMQDYSAVVAELKDPLNDVETLIVFILYVRYPLIYFFGIITHCL